MTRFFRNLALATTALLPLGIGFAVAGPTGGVVVGGGATIKDPGTRNVTIDQWTQRAIINWHTFNIGTGETTHFNQPNAQAVVLNRVTGGLGPSQIDGMLTANGRVFVINRDGILFGSNAVVNTAGFLATTSDIKNEDFMAGRYNFNIPGRPDASIVNHGTITAHSAGFAALVAPGVRNTGTITATLGTVGLAAGNSFTLDLYGDKLITLAVGDAIANQVRDVETGKTLNSLVENAGRLRANGGRVELTAAAARTIVDSVINNSGVVEANRIGQHGGTIVLAAATAATKGADAPKQTIKVAGTLSAAAKKSGKGGKVVVTGEDIKVTGARVDVSGPAGGGTVLIGGDWGGGKPTTGLVKHPGARLENEKIPTAATVTIDKNTVINASATANGTGGKVIVWSDDKTTFAGTILATGGPSGGDGGFAEVSGHRLLDYLGFTDLRAPQGKFGTLLLDPYDLTICNCEDGNITGFKATGDNSRLSVARLEKALGAADVIVTTGRAGDPGDQAGNITVASPIHWETKSTLTLSAYSDIIINPGVVISNIGAGNLILRADNSGRGSGTVNFLGCLVGCEGPADLAKVDFSQSTGKVAIYYNPPSFDGENRYLNPRDYSSNVLTKPGVPNQLTAYMLVNNADDLAAIGQNTFTLSQTYALGTSFSAAEFAGFRSGTRFTGIFDGYGGIDQNNTISSLSFALFPIIGKDGIVRNLDLSNVQINTDGVGGRYGVLAALNEGTIDHLRVTNGVIDASASNGVTIVGGLVGQNSGTITNSSTTMAVIVGNGAVGPNYAGGLVGLNTGTIAGSSSAGGVTGGFNSLVGGLVGQNDGMILASSALGVVTGVGSNDGGFAMIGGLVGVNHGTVQDSSAAAMVIGSFAYAGGLVGLNSGTVTGTSPGQVRADGTVLVDGDQSIGGGLVGVNADGGIVHNAAVTGGVAVGPFGTTTDALRLGGLVGYNAGTIDHSVAAVSVQGGVGAAGGLVGQNDGMILASSASGAVSGAGTVDGGIAMLGGLVGVNHGTVQDSSAKATVIGSFAYAGGLVGFNSGIITGTSPGQVRADGTVLVDGALSIGGGLVGVNVAEGIIRNAGATGLVAIGTGTDALRLGGLVGYNAGTIDHAVAAVTVEGGAGPTGGLVGQNDGMILASSASGAVSGSGIAGRLAMLGGLVGLNRGTVQDSSADAKVVGSFAVAGGLVGFNSGTITGTNPGQVRADGSVVVDGAQSIGGGLVGFNAAEGVIHNAGATGLVAIGGTGTDAVDLGGLVGYNAGRIEHAFATVAVKGGLGTAGGLVGQNDGTILASIASGSVSGAGFAGGGLVGINRGTVQDSSTDAKVDGSFANAGGLVGYNSGAITNASATGAVTSDGTGIAVGGLVGFNSLSGSIDKSFATGAVTVKGQSDMTAGGLVGENQGSITNSHATGSVAGIGGAHVYLGGLVGNNTGTITGSHATGSVASSGGMFAFVGGLVGFNQGEIQNSQAGGNVFADSGFVFAGGYVGVNTGAISNTLRSDSAGNLIADATGNVTLAGTATGAAGGFAGRNLNFITASVATGAVAVGDNGFAGGFAGWNGALISQSYAGGAVTGGKNSYVGGFAALNAGEINGSAAAGTVTGGAGSFVGGLVAVNIGIPDLGVAVADVSRPQFTLFTPGVISHSYAFGNVTGGDNSVVGGLVALNLGRIDQTYSIGLVSGGQGSVLGGLVALNDGTFNVPIVPGDGIAGQVQLAALGATGTVTNSYWDVQRSGQRTSAGGDPFPAGNALPPGFDTTWIVNGYPCQPGFCGGLPSRVPLPDPTPTPDPTPSPPPVPPPPGPPVVPDPVLPDPLPQVQPPPSPPAVVAPTLPQPTLQLVDVRLPDPQPTTPGEVVSTQSTTTGSTGSRQASQPSGNGPRRPDGRPSNVPPIGETRFINNEVVFQICGDVPAQRIQRTMRTLRLDLISSQSLGLIGCTMYHSRITNGRSVRDIIIALERDRLIDEVTPNYTFALAQNATSPAPASEGDSAQWAVAKLRLAEAHQVAKGDNILIAVIDSEIDTKHPDLEGAIAGRYDAVGPADKPHPHGTGMAGAIASHRKLIGTAPGARLLAIRAFGGGAAGAQGTTVQIVKGIDWAVGQGAKIVNMSFAGPRDPTLQKAFKAALDKGVVLIAAAGNAGPKSPPLYPGADPSVIAVSATDADDQVYVNANRGKYVAVAAPGVDILVPAPEGNYEFTTGTSVASAEVSGVAALLLQRDPNMDSATVREILTSTANRLGAKGRTDELGYGLVDAYRAVTSVNAVSAKSASASGTGATSRN